MVPNFITAEKALSADCGQGFFSLNFWKRDFQKFVDFPVEIR